MRAFVIFLLAIALSVRADDEAQYKTAIKLFKTKDYSTALVLLESLNKKDPDSAKVLLALGFAYSKTDKKDKASACYRKIVRANLEGGKNAEEATKALKYLAEMNDGFARVYESAGELEMKIKDAKSKRDRQFMKAAVRQLYDYALSDEAWTVETKETPETEPAPAKEEKAGDARVQHFPASRRTDIMAMFDAAKNLAAGGEVKASAHYQGREPASILSGKREGIQWTLKTEPGWIETTWKKPPVGRYVVLINNTINKEKALGWGEKSKVTVNGEQAFTIKRNFYRNEIVVIDLGKTTRIKSVRCDLAAGSYSGLAGLKIHRWKK